MSDRRLRTVETPHSFQGVIVSPQSTIDANRVIWRGDDASIVDACYSAQHGEAWLTLHGRIVL